MQNSGVSEICPLLTLIRPLDLNVNVPLKNNTDNLKAENDELSCCFSCKKIMEMYMSRNNVLGFQPDSIIK